MFLTINYKLLGLFLLWQSPSVYLYSYVFFNYFSVFKVKLADGATLIVKISDSRRYDELKEPFPVNTLYLPIKTKTKRKGVAKPLSELLPTSVDSKKFKDDLLNSFKEVTMHALLL